MDILKMTRSIKPISGYNNLNYTAELEGRKVIIRVPIEDSEPMNPRMIPEAQMLSLLNNLEGFPVPRLYQSSEDPKFMIMEFIEGELINDVYPRGCRLPEQFIPQTVALLQKLSSLELIGNPLCTYFQDWPQSGDTEGFYLHMISLLEQTYLKLRGHYSYLYEMFELPDDLFERFRRIAGQLTPRPFVLSHGDLHRKNCILRNTEIVFLDWELSMIADPLYDVAVHLFKMEYLPEEQELFVGMLHDSLPTRFLAGFEHDLTSYLKAEQARALLIDSVRYVGQFHTAGTSEVLKKQLASKLETKLLQASAFWGNKCFSAEHIYDILSR
ncbi:phosphotransferase [Paenibacillus sp. FSL H7-0350]|uniref:phosphotransferase family protein n=1 Tax=Paenibacillus sp. FSL H7-0350 TaxID=2975345 RepID=UPI00315880F3